MAKKPKKRMAKTGLTTASESDPRATKQELRRHIRAMQEVSGLARQLARAIASADRHVADTRSLLQRREQLLAGDSAGH